MKGYYFSGKRHTCDCKKEPEEVRKGLTLVRVHVISGNDEFHTLHPLSQH